MHQIRFRSWPCLRPVIQGGFGCFLVPSSAAGAYAATGSEPPAASSVSPNLFFEGGEENEGGADQGEGSGEGATALVWGPGS